MIVARADWDKLREVVAENPSYEALQEFDDYSPDWWSVAEGEEWEDYFFEINYALYFMEEVYENLREALSEEERRVTDPVANLVAGCYYDPEHDPLYNSRGDRDPESEFYERPFDLDEQYRHIQKAVTLLCVLSPATVRRYLSLWDRVPFEKLRVAFEALRERRAGDSEWELVEDYIEDWPRFRSYFDVFRGELERAASEERAVVIQL